MDYDYDYDGGRDILQAVRSCSDVTLPHADIRSRAEADLAIIFTHRPPELRLVCRTMPAFGVYG